MYRSKMLTTVEEINQIKNAVGNDSISLKINQL